MQAKRFILMMLVMLMSMAGAWAQNNVIRYTATEKLNGLDWHRVSGNLANVVTHEYNTETHEGVVTFNKEVTIIGESAFYGCSSLTSIELPASITSIGNEAFYQCSSLKTVTINGQQTLNATGYWTDNIGPQGLGKITETFGNQVEEYILNGNITIIPERKFYHCSITSITLPETLTEIQRDAFSFCPLTSITIPAYVTSIGRYPFRECPLQSITVNSTTPPTLDDSFIDVNNSIPVYVPEGTADTYKAAEGWKDFGDNITEVRPAYEIADEATYSIQCNIKAAQFTYTRTFSTAQPNKWQSLFVPFDIEMTAEVLEKCDIAKPYMVATEGSTDGNIHDDDCGDVVVLKKLKLGDTAKHGTPYFIRPKESGEFRLEYDAVTVYASADVTTLTCSTTEDDYAFVGQYTAGKPDSGTTWYALASGNFQLGGNNSPNLSAQRWYMTKTSKAGSPSPALAKSLRVITFGEDEEATAIVAARANQQTNGAIYSLSGVRLSKPQKGLNIIGGKKVLIK